MIRKHFHEDGAALLELALVLPLVLAVIFFFLGLALSQNASTSLHTAMADAALISNTRADKFRMNFNRLTSPRDGIIDELHTWYDGNGSFSDIESSGILKSLFIKDGVGDFSTVMARDVFRYVDNPPEGIRNFTDGAGPQEPPLFYYYILAYIYQALERSLGSSVRYPCERPLSKTGCLTCGFYPTPSGSTENSTQDIRSLDGLKDVHIRCRYKANLTVVGSLMGADFLSPEIERTVHLIRDEY